MKRTVGVLVLVAASSVFADEPEPDRAWPWLLGAYGVGVVADVATTERGIGAGAREGNPLYSWAGPDGVTPLRLAVGVTLGCALHELHKTKPKAARRIAIAATVLSVLVAAHNHGVYREQRED